MVAMDLLREVAALSLVEHDGEDGRRKPYARRGENLEVGTNPTPMSLWFMVYL